MTRFSSLSRRGRIILAATLAALALACAALAYWSTSGTGSASGSVGSLAAPTGASASSTTGSSNVSVSWTASEPLGGVSPTGYYLRRYSGSTPTAAGGGCGTPAAPVNQTSCTDEEVADGTYTYTVVAVYHSWTAESAHSSAVAVVGDVTPPTTTLTTSPASPEGSNGWFQKTSVEFTLGAEDSGAGVGMTRYTLDGGSTQTYSGAVTVSGEGAHAVTYWSVDKATNEESHHTTQIKIDSEAPTNAISIDSPTHALLSGSTLYFASGLAGSFTLTNTVSDTASGPAAATFPLVSATNWSHAAQTVTTPGGGPFASSTYSWTAGAGTPSGAQANFTSADDAGNASANTVLTFVADAAAPTGGAVSVNGTAASAGGSTSTATNTGYAINSRSDYAETQSASQSGLASSTLTIQSATLAGNTCGPAGSGGPYTTATPVSGTSNPSLETGYCYVYTLTGTDNVGNSTTVKTTVKVDTTGPSSPTVTLSTATGNTFISGTTVFINAQAGREGSFKATGASTDTQTGITSIKLPSLTGFSEGGGTLSSPFETKYKWSGAVAASGLQSVTATNGVGLTTTNASAFTVTPDTTAPSSAGTVSVPSRAHGSVAVTFSGAADAGSGTSAAAGELLRAEATYTVSTDTCGSFGGFAKVGSAGPSSPATDATVANNKCYQYEYKASDNVGNTTTSAASGTVKVDTAAPKAEKIEAKNGGGTAKEVDVKDFVTYTLNENIDPASITSAWSVGNTPDQSVVFTVKDTGEGNGTNKPDNFSVTTAGVHLGTVEMSGGNWVTVKGGSASWNSTMHFASTEGKTVITVTLNSLVAGASARGQQAEDTFTWSPDAAIADLAGNSVDTATKPTDKAVHF